MLLTLFREDSGSRVWLCIRLCGKGGGGVREICDHNSVFRKDSERGVRCCWKSVCSEGKAELDWFVGTTTASSGRTAAGEGSGVTTYSISSFSSRRRVRDGFFITSGCPWRIVEEESEPYRRKQTLDTSVVLLSTLRISASDGDMRELVKGWGKREQDKQSERMVRYQRQNPKKRKIEG